MELVSATSSISVEYPAAPPTPPEIVARSVGTTFPRQNVELVQKIASALSLLKDDDNSCLDEFSGILHNYSYPDIVKSCPKVLQIVVSMFLEKPRSIGRRKVLVLLANEIEEIAQTFSGLRSLEACGALDAMDEVLKLCPWPKSWTASPKDLPDVLVLQSHYCTLAKQHSPWLLSGDEYCTIGIVLQYCQELILGDKNQDCSKYTFVHLGSGSGKALLSTSSILCSNSFTGLRSTLFKLLGIENNARCIHNSNLNLVQYLQQHKDCPPPHQLQFLNVDMTLESPGGGWVEAPAVVFVNATSFSAALMLKLGNLAKKLPKGSRVISVSRPVPRAGVHSLDERTWALEWQGEYPMSWGVATFYIHKRV